MIEKIRKEIKTIINELEEDYDMSYEDMFDCYLNNSEAINYHVGVSFVEGMRKAILIMEKENEAR